MIDYFEESEFLNLSWEYWILYFLLCILGEQLWLDYGMNSSWDELIIWEGIIIWSYDLVWQYDFWIEKLAQVLWILYREKLWWMLNVWSDFLDFISYQYILFYMFICIGYENDVSEIMKIGLRYYWLMLIVKVFSITKDSSGKYMVYVCPSWVLIKGNKWMCIIR